MKDKEFWDSNLWIYLFTKSEYPEDVRKRQKLELMLRLHPQIISSVQVLNEVANALLRKYTYPENEVREFLRQILSLTENQPMVSDFSFRALDLKQRYQLGWYDSLIVAVSLGSDCRVLYSEDMQDGLIIEGTLTILNPFNI